MPEETLDHLEGYRGSRPVRVGNGACEQLQLDIYGEVMDSIYLYDKYGSPIAYDAWHRIRPLIDWVADNWMKPDDGIWEVRGGQQPIQRCSAGWHSTGRLGWRRSAVCR
jgi:GH15 family glucan-1,4-alpha-glucosidase